MNYFLLVLDPLHVLSLLCLLIFSILCSLFFLLVALNPVSFPITLLFLSFSHSSSLSIVTLSPFLKLLSLSFSFSFFLSNIYPGEIYLKRLCTPSGVSLVDRYLIRGGYQSRLVERVQGLVLPITGIYYKSQIRGLKLRKLFTLHFSKFEKVAFYMKILVTQTITQVTR